MLLTLALVAALLPQSHPEAKPNSFVAADLAWMLTASGLVLFMVPGLAFFYGGMVSKRNVISTMLQSFIALGVISLLWYVVGFSLGNVAQLDELAVCIKNVRAAALNKSICVIVGGPLFLANPEFVAYVNADAASTDGAQAPELATRLVLAQGQGSKLSTDSPA